MRVNPNMVPDVLSAISRTQAAQAIALQQMSSGKRVTVPSDDPAAAAALVENHSRSDIVDQYTSNVRTTSEMMQTAESALNAIVTEVGKAISVGVQGANGTLSNANRQALADQVLGSLTNIVSQANLSYRGRYLFAGTASGSAPFVADSNSPSGYRYAGNSNVNLVPVGDGFQVPVNQPGDELFQKAGNDLLGSLQALASALRSGSLDTIGTATNELRRALDYVTQKRVFYGNITSQLNSQETFLQGETVNIKSEENSLIGIDFATAVMNFSQAQTAHQATLAAAGRVLPQTLLDYLR